MIFNLGSRVQIKSDIAAPTKHLSGEVAGRAEFLHAEPTYFLRFTDPHGMPQEGWFAESRLVNPNE
jgi:hypothetical protein